MNNCTPVAPFLCHSISTNINTFSNKSNNRRNSKNPLFDLWFIYFTRIHHSWTNNCFVCYENIAKLRSHWLPGLVITNERQLNQFLAICVSLRYFGSRTLINHIIFFKQAQLWLLSQFPSNSSKQLKKHQNHLKYTL